MTETINVSVVEIRGQAAVVEWMDDGCPHRAIVPHDAASGGHCDTETLRRGIRYGDDFSEALKDVGPVTPQEIECMLHRFDLWTGEDIGADVKMARLALAEVFGRYLAALLRNTGKKAKEKARAAYHDQND
jgi:hypothetical protein